MYPDRDTFEHTFNTARDQSMVESGVTEGEKNTSSFLFYCVNTTAQMNPQAKKQRFPKLSQKRNSS